MIHQTHSIRLSSFATRFFNRPLKKAWFLALQRPGTFSNMKASGFIADMRDAACQIAISKFDFVRKPCLTKWRRSCIRSPSSAADGRVRLARRPNSIEVYLCIPALAAPVAMVCIANLCKFKTATCLRQRGASGGRHLQTLFLAHAVLLCEHEVFCLSQTHRPACAVFLLSLAAHLARHSTSTYFSQDTRNRPTAAPVQRSH